MFPKRTVSNFWASATALRTKTDVVLVKYRADSLPGTVKPIAIQQLTPTLNCHCHGGIMIK